MPAGLFGRVSPSTSNETYGHHAGVDNTNASAQDGSTGRNGNSSGGAPNGAIKLRGEVGKYIGANACLLYTSPSPRDHQPSRMPSSA